MFIYLFIYLCIFIHVFIYIFIYILVVSFRVKDGVSCNHSIESELGRRLFSFFGCFYRIYAVLFIVKWFHFRERKMVKQYQK